MSSIEKLLIQGIRSFGAGDSEKAVIQFGTPLTLITGQNGAGKTTIIECLKYITTGDQPPNTKGGAFVHDPKLVGETQVRGVVKLRFSDITGCMVTCHRMLQSVQKLKKIEVKTLDASLEKVVGGEKKKVTRRCADIDKEMIEHLGVSKAILSNVIFCHQEDSAWPLSEGKALKLKFDEIFASTRYSKALESIRKLRTEQMNDCRVHSTELDYLKKQKLKADELEADLKELQRKVESSRAEMTRLEHDMAPNEERKQKMDDMYQEADDMKTRIAELESSKRELERSQAELVGKIKHPFTGTQQELQRLRDDHHNQLERNRQELTNVEWQQDRIRSEMERVEHQLSQLYQEHGRRETEHKHHMNRVKTRDGQVVSLAGQLEVEGHSKGPFPASTVKQFLSEVAREIKEREERAKQERHSFSLKEESLQKQIDELRTNLAQLDQSLKMRRKTVTENQERMTAIGRELASLGTRSSALEGLERDLSAAERELQEARLHTDIPKMEEALAAMRSSKKRLDEKVSELQQELAVISRQSSSRGALEAFRKDKRSKEEQYQNEMCAMEPELLSVLGHIPAPDDRDLAAKLSEIERRNRQEMRACEEQLQRRRSEMSRLQTQLEAAESQLKAKRSKMEALQLEVSEVCQGEEAYEEALRRLQQDMEQNMNDMHTVKGSLQFFRKSLEKVHSSRKCPMCTRHFDDEPSFQKAVKSITDRLNESIPRLQPQLDEKHHQLQERQKRLQQLQPKIEELSQVRDKDIPHLEAIREQREGEIRKLQTDLKKVEEKQSGIRSTLEQVRGLQPHVTQTSQLRRDLEELDARISSEEGKLGGSDSSRSQLVVHRELQEVQMKSKELELKMDHKRNEISTSDKEIRELEKKVHQLRDEKLKLQERLQKRQGLVVKKEELAADVQSNEREIKVLSHRRGPVQEKLSQLEDERREVVLSQAETEALNKTELDGLRSAEDTIRTTTQHINRYISEGEESALQQCNDKIAELKREVQEKEEKKKQLEEQKKVLQEQVANAKVRERELEDSLRLMGLRAEVGRKGQEAQRLRGKMREMGLDKYEEEYQRLQRELDRLRQEMARIKGVKGAQEERVREIQRELQGDLYRDIATRHKGMLVTLKTTEMATKDLDKYYKILDRAIMRYHKLKMEEINKIIRELWMKTYKGGDIDTIEIRSDDGTEESGGIKTRRVYHYRVVMIKGDTVLDMRGRCSAGQKVLASILIRLALAETFCVNCGLLALDEPTTNLDRDNIEGLAQALADIVKDRSRQKNFQLIVITHDKEFVDMLGQAGYTEHYFKVSKEVGECSRISKHPLSGMEH